MKWHDHTDEQALTEILVGHSIASVETDDEIGPDAVLILDNGTRLELAGNQGGCVCGAGDYELTAVSALPNLITKAEVVEDAGDYDQRTYSIFVWSEHPSMRTELARFEGDDGSGFYGTGFRFAVHASTLNQQVSGGDR